MGLQKSSTNGIIGYTMHEKATSEWVSWIALSKSH